MKPCEKSFDRFRNLLIILSRLCYTFIHSMSLRFVIVFRQLNYTKTIGFMLFLCQLLLNFQGAFALGAVLITIVLIVPGCHHLFKVETLNLMQLGSVYLYAFASMLIIQLFKWIRMKKWFAGKLVARLSEK